MLTKQVAGCTAGTLRTYRWWLEQLLLAGPDVGALAVPELLRQPPGARSQSFSPTPGLPDTADVFPMVCRDGRRIAVAA